MSSSVRSGSDTAVLPAGPEAPAVTGRKATIRMRAATHSTRPVPTVAVAEDEGPPTPSTLDTVSITLSNLRMGTNSELSNASESEDVNDRDLRPRGIGGDERGSRRGVLRDPDSNPYSLLEGEGELADADLSEGMGGDRHRRSRRRRNDQEPSVMDAAAESDNQAGPSENGLGKNHLVYQPSLLGNSF
ncbi:hypothetical protein XENOCAPTIV_027077 [Xenoophorus captivus]|uniref:Fragile X-related protein 1 C-terminal region 1 domain-containing protein n=1 Tax=Xenoophorus captivus TaxID=1517983 RepID=A0ABV0R3S6_9TELE